MSHTEVTLMVDRIEGELAVLESPNKYMIKIPTQILPTGISEGDALDVKFEINRFVAKSRQSDIEKLLKELMGD